MKKKRRWFYNIVWGGLCYTRECTDHVYAWSGSIPCTGYKKCIYCGKPKDED